LHTLHLTLAIFTPHQALKVYFPDIIRDRSRPVLSFAHILLHTLPEEFSEHIGGSLLLRVRCMRVDIHGRGGLRVPDAGAHILYRDTSVD